MNGVKRILSGLLMGALLVGFEAAAGSQIDDSGAVGAGMESPLPAPKGLRATPIAGGVLLRWKPVEGSDGYRVYWGRKGDVVRRSALVDDVGPDRFQYEVRGLSPGVPFKFRVSALSRCKEGRLSRQVAAAAKGKDLTKSGAGIELKTEEEGGPTDGAETIRAESGKAHSLPAPRGLRATPEVRGVLLQWQPVRGSDGYRIYWERQGLVNRCSARLNDVAPGEVRCEVGDLEPGIRYNFRVCALRSSIKGPLSRQVGAAPKDDDPMDPPPEVSPPSDSAP